MQDTQLIQNVLMGQTECFDQLVNKHQTQVCRIIYSMIRNSEAVLDLAQETFLKAYQNLSQLKDKNKFEYWLYRIAANECKMWLRKRQHDWILLSEDIEAQRDLSDLAPMPDEELIKAELHAKVIKAVESLSEKNRQVVKLFYFEGLALREISESLGISLSAVASRLHHAKAELRRRLEPFYSGFGFCSRLLLSRLESALLINSAGTASMTKIFLFSIFLHLIGLQLWPFVGDFTSMNRFDSSMNTVQMNTLGYRAIPTILLAPDGTGQYHLGNSKRRTAVKEKDDTGILLAMANAVGNANSQQINQMSANFASGSEPTGEIHYTISISKPKSHQLQVECDIRNFPLDDLDLEMTKAFAGAVDLPDRIQNLMVTDANGNPLKIWKGQRGAWWIHVKEVMPRSVKLSYQIDASSGIARTTAVGQPLLNRNYGFFFGHALFITPEISHRYHPQVTVEFNVPNRWEVVTTWGFKQRVYQPGGLRTLKHSIIALGDYRVYPRQLLNKQIAFAIRESDWATAKKLDKILNKYQEHLAVLFANASHPPALVVLNRGLGETNGFSQVSNGIVITLRDLKKLDSKKAWDIYLKESLISDTVIEPWNAIHAIKPENAKRSKWFSEGFAKYHRRTISVDQLPPDFQNELSKRGKWFPGGPAQYRREAASPDQLPRYVLNGLYTSYGSNREISAVESGWDTGRGALIALILDWKIRRHSGGRKSLDDLMMAMYQQFGPLTSQRYTNEDIFQIASDLTGENLSDFYLKYVLRTEELPLAECLDELGFYIEEQIDDICDLGMTLKQQKGGYLVTAVAKGGPAEQSGFVAGDLITGSSASGRSGYAIAIDSSEQPAAKFSTNNKFITFYTSRGTRILNPRIKYDGVYVRRIVAK